MPLLDVLIIGGGPGGLSVATGLARQLYTAVVFDSKLYRNARMNHMHNVLGWDHCNPEDFRAKGRADLKARYDTVTLEDTKVESIRRTESGLFEATDAQGRVWAAKKVVLAVGCQDIMPDIPGYDEAWGRGIYHCLFCDGYEDRGVISAGVLAIGDIAKVSHTLNVARMAKRLTSKVMLYVDGSKELSEQIVTSLGGDDGIAVDERHIIRIEKVDKEISEVIFHFEDGSNIHHGFIAHKPKSKVNGPFVEQLGLEVNEFGAVETVQPWYETTLKGVFAIGDCASAVPAVNQAVAQGTFAAAGLAAQLAAE